MLVKGATGVYSPATHELTWWRLAQHTCVIQQVKSNVRKGSGGCFHWFLYYMWLGVSFLHNDNVYTLCGRRWCIPIWWCHMSVKSFHFTAPWAVCSEASPGQQWNNHPSKIFITDSLLLGRYRWSTHWTLRDTVLRKICPSHDVIVLYMLDCFRNIW